MTEGGELSRMELAEAAPDRGPRESVGRSRVAATAIAIASSALLAAEATALGALPWGVGPGLLISTALSLPLALLLCCAIWRVSTPLQRRFESSLGFNELPAVGLVALALLLTGMYLSNSLLVDAPLQKRTLIGYAASAVAAVALTLLLRSTIRRVVAPVSAWSSLLVATALVGVTAAILDAVFLTQAYRPLHYALFCMELFAFCTLAVQVCVARRFWASGAAGGVLIVYALVAWSSADGSPSAAFKAVLGTVSPHQRLLLFVQRLTDADDDGFAARLGGPDCDDDNPQAFPMSVEGRDCLGWRERAVSPQPLAVTEGAGRGTPELLVLVTIDALRCGFGQHGRLELRQACPDLERLVAEGKARFDAYTTYPSTGYALGSLHSGKITYRPSDPDAMLLGDWLQHRGWRTAVISSHPYQLSATIARSFQQLDRSLEAQAARPAAISSEPITDLALRTVRTHFERAGAARLFLWVHYFDPHAPYVDEQASSWAISSDVARYADEVRRTSAAVARLAKGIGETGSIPSAVLLVTADHGEEFGEKGTTYHGASINDAAVRVPVFVWSPDPARLRELPRDLPASAIEVAPYVAAVATGGSFASRNEAFFMTREFNNPILGFYRDGWKLIHHQQLGITALHHIATDPDELVNLASEHAAIVDDLGRRLMGYLTAPWPSLADTIAPATGH